MIYLASASSRLLKINLLFSLFSLSLIDLLIHTLYFYNYLTIIISLNT